MFDKIKEVKMEEINESKKGFQITVKNLDTGEILIDSATKCVIGAYEGSKEGDAACAKGIVVTSCNTQTLMGTIEAANSAVAKTKKKIIERVLPQLLSDILK